MDLTLVDVTGLPDVSVGDEVILLGSLDGIERGRARACGAGGYGFI